MFMYTCVLTESCAVIRWCTLAYLYSMLRCMWYVHVPLRTYWLLRCNLWGRQSRTIVAGAQQLDSTWRHFKRWCPQSLQLKVNSSVNTTRYTWAYSYMGRHNAKCESNLTLRSLSNTLWRWCWKNTEVAAHIIYSTQLLLLLLIITIIIVFFFFSALRSRPCPAFQRCSQQDFACATTQTVRTMLKLGQKRNWLATLKRTQRISYA